jgi:arabinofuranosyltransferase
MLPNPRRSFGPALAALAIAALLAALIVAMWPFTVDDAYITLRYAREWAAGFGPVYQPGSVPAEGYTTFLWMALLVIPHLLRLDAVLVAKLLGVIATLALVALTAAWTARLARTHAPDAGQGVAPWTAGAIAALALACLPATAVHAVSGMETALFAFLLLGLVALCGDVAARNTRRLKWLGPCALLLGLTRPEGNLAALLALGVTLHLMPRTSRPRLLRWLVGAYILPGIVYFVWRWNYYGATLPLPFYLKLAGQHGLPGLARVAGFAGTLALHLGALVTLALIRPPRQLWPALAAATGLMLFFLFPAHIMGYHARYLFPVAPLLCVLAGLGVARLDRTLALRVSRLAARARPIAVGLAGLLALSSLSGSASAVLDRRFYADGLRHAHLALGLKLATLPPGTLAIADAGLVPYVSGWRTIDLLGLNDRHLALAHGPDPAYVLSQQPDVVVIASAERDRIVPAAWDGSSVAVANACQADGMRLVSRLRFDDHYYLLVLAHPEDPRAAALMGAESTGPLTAK